MLNRLSGTSLRLRVGLGVAMLTAGGMSLFFGWGWVAGITGVVAGAYAGYKTPDASVVSNT